MVSREKPVGPNEYGRGCGTGCGQGEALVQPWLILARFYSTVLEQTRVGNRPDSVYLGIRSDFMAVARIIAEIEGSNPRSTVIRIAGSVSNATPRRVFRTAVSDLVWWNPLVMTGD